MSHFNSSKSAIFHFHLEYARAYYPDLSLMEQLTLASIETLIDGYSGPVYGTDDYIRQVLTKVNARRMQTP